MRISVCGSVHQNGTPEGLDQMIHYILQMSVKHSVEIEQRFYTLLLSKGYQLGGIRILSAKGVIDTDILISIGGDGTFLRAAKLIAGTDARILGINSGRLGFLASIQPEEFCEIWPEIEAGKGKVESRDLLEYFIKQEDGSLKPKGLILNEVAVMKRDTASMITMETFVDGELIANIEGDGLLVSTPTGSTAYALSVNGPIVHPLSPTLSICSIAPHMLNMRPIVLPNNVEVEIKVLSRTGTYLLAGDGKSLPQTTEGSIIVRLSDKRLNVLHPSNYSFYETLRNKLMWGKDPRW